MKTFLSLGLLGFFVMGVLSFANDVPSSSPPAKISRQEIQPLNPAIDMTGYLRVADEAARHRETHRLSEEDFIKTSQEPGVIILDARSRQKYDELHVKGAINLSFPDITVESLQKTFPDKNARILIYCNNNFKNAEGPFPSKMPTASLNISTYIALYSHGYRNIYELAPLVDIHDSKLTFESSPMGEKKP